MWRVWGGVSGVLLPSCCCDSAALAHARTGELHWLRADKAAPGALLQVAAQLRQLQAQVEQLSGGGALEREHHQLQQHREQLHKVAVHARELKAQNSELAQRAARLPDLKRDHKQLKQLVSRVGGRAGDRAVRVPVTCIPRHCCSEPLCKIEPERESGAGGSWRYLAGLGERCQGRGATAASCAAAGGG
jgi:hypothetical protein